MSKSGRWRQQGGRAGAEAGSNFINGAWGKTLQRKRTKLTPEWKRRNAKAPFLSVDKRKKEGGTIPEKSGGKMNFVG